MKCKGCNIELQDYESKYCIDCFWPNIKTRRCPLKLGHNFTDHTLKYGIRKCTHCDETHDAITWNI